MPQVKVLQSNFSSGELSQKAQGRVDIARYPNAVERAENVISRTLGSADKRPGSQYLYPLKDMTKRARLVPYVVSKDQSFMLEMGDGYMRVYKADGTRVETTPGTAYEIATPYDQTQNREFDFTQAEDAMYLFHSDKYPNRLRRFTDNSWDLSNAPFTTTPFAEQGLYPAVSLTLSSVAVGVGVSATASAGVFMASDVGRAILAGPGVGVITAVGSSTAATIEIKVAFSSTSVASGTWNLDSSPQATLTPGAKDPVGASVSLTLSADGWRAAEDVGKFIKGNGGLVQITAVSSPTVATGKIIKVLTSTVAIPALAWTLESTVWTATDGYPRTGTMHEQRLVTAGTKKKPQTMWGSKSGEPLDFTLGTNDDDAYAYTIGTSNKNQVNPVRYIVSSSNLVLLTYGGEYSARGGTDKPITPTNIKIKPETPHGCKDVPPIVVGKEVLFSQRAGRKLRATRFDYTEDGYKSPDLTTLGEHLTEGRIAGACFQQEPDPIIWVWLENGKLISLTLDRDLDVIAWNSHRIDGAVEWVASMPAGDSEQVWMIIRRKKGDGSIVRYIERLQPDWYPIYGTAMPAPDDFPPGESPDNWGYQLDCAISMDDPAGKAVWTGLGHLEGRVVHCIADGAHLGDFTVTSGQITLPRDAKRVLIGLLFLPYIKLLTPEVQFNGTSQGSPMSTSELWIHVYKSTAVTVNGELVITGRKNGPAQLDFPPQLFTGRESVSMLGWERDGTSGPEISQEAPFPFSLLSVIRRVTV